MGSYREYERWMPPAVYKKSLSADCFLLGLGVERRRDEPQRARAQS